MSSVTLRNVHKVFPNGVEAVKNFSLNIADKEFVVIVGPSGCGKSTTLRMIAGLENVTGGEVLIGDRVMSNVPAKDRNISMVFQNYALFTHLSVFDNIAFGLRVRKTPKAEIRQKVDEAAKILGIEHLLKRKPNQLSGGEKQRVAMGRALVRNPDAYLMDEPLSNLDAMLRVQVRAELSLLRERLQNTFIYVTHDQTEAMTLGDRIVVMKDGVIQQVSTPEEVYNRPANRFVAGFIGSPQMNFIEREIDGQKRTLGIRPESVLLCGAEDTGARRATVRLLELLGPETLLHLDMDNDRIIAKTAPDCGAVPCDEVFVRFDERKLHIFNTETGERVEA